MTETLPDTLPAKLRGAMHELTHHYPANFIADAAMLLMPEAHRADVAACHFGNDTTVATKAIVRRFGGMNVAHVALDTLEIGGLIEVLRGQIGKLDRAHARQALADLVKVAEEKGGSTAFWGETEDGAPLFSSTMKPSGRIRIREQDAVREYTLSRFVTEYDQETGATRRIAVYHEITKEQSDGQ